jgi:GAF domain-containing protein
LSQQNEEIKAQAEELMQQNEEIESQTEELGRQNEELHDSNTRLGSREAMLQSLLNSSRTPESGPQALEDACRRGLEILGDPIESICILEQVGEQLSMRAQASLDGGTPLPEKWPLAGSLARVVLQENTTAYVHDLLQEPALAAPFVAGMKARSLLATPLRFDGTGGGLLVACSENPSHWTQEQFRMIEWLAIQCGLIMDGLRWQKALTDRAHEVEAANKAKDRFLAMLSHELRTPLTPVLAAAGILETDERLPADARDDLKMMRRNVAIQSRLIDDLLDLTRIERGKLDINPQLLNVAMLLRETATIVAPDLDAKDQTLSMRLELPDGCSIMGDGARLQQVFWNLLKNAIKFSPVKETLKYPLRSSEPGNRD